MHEPPSSPIIHPSRRNLPPAPAQAPPMQAPQRPASPDGPASFADEGLLSSFRTSDRTPGLPSKRMTDALASMQATIADLQAARDQDAERVERLESLLKAASADSSATSTSVQRIEAMLSTPNPAIADELAKLREENAKAIASLAEQISATPTLPVTEAAPTSHRSPAPIDPLNPGLTPPPSAQPQYAQYPGAPHAGLAPQSQAQAPMPMASQQAPAAHMWAQWSQHPQFPQMQYPAPSPQYQWAQAPGMQPVASPAPNRPTDMTAYPAPAQPTQRTDERTNAQ